MKSNNKKKSTHLVRGINVLPLSVLQKRPLLECLPSLRDVRAIQGIGASGFEPLHEAWLAKLDTSVVAGDDGHVEGDGKKG